MNGKTPLNPMVLAAIKVVKLKRQFKWSDEELEKNWGGKTGVQQKIADKWDIFDPTRDFRRDPGWDWRNFYKSQ
ncbi:unnamed protein product, partial [Porites evermanni]